ncbi:MAG: hypothetical protein NTZ45_02300 [Methylococcales bacterium]|nr:hypothetical protein [Methylococcales bacterium]
MTINSGTAPDDEAQLAKQQAQDEHDALLIHEALLVQYAETFKRLAQ